MSKFWELFLPSVFIVVGLVIAAIIAAITPLREAPLVLWCIFVGIVGVLLGYLFLLVFVGVWCCIEGIYRVITGRKKKGQNSRYLT